MFKSGYVTIVGSPNAGKSSFLNQVVGQKVAIVSDKVQTTRDLIKGVYNEENCQIIFLDTPGFHKSYNKLNVYMNKQIEFSLMEIDVLIYMVDAYYGIGKKEKENLDRLSKINNVKKIAVINKIDIVSQEKVVSMIEDLKKEEQFEDILAISVKEEFNYNAVIKTIKEHLTDNVKYYDDDTFCDYGDDFFVEEIIREKVLNLTHEEIPHSVGVKVTEFEEEDGKYYIAANVYVERDSQKGIIIGKSGSMLKQIGKAARIELKEEFESPIYLDLHVKVLSNWAKKLDSLHEIGYDLD